MLLNEVVKEVGMTKRAVKFYEEKGLLSVKKDSNGYRNYSKDDVEVLKKISVYRKLGINVDDIKKLLNGDNKDRLIHIYQQKLQEMKLAGGIVKETRTADEMISYYRDMSDEEYERLKAIVREGSKLKAGILKYHPSCIAQRKMMKEFQNKGFNDILIPNLMVLSPKYAEYKKALDHVNDRICREIGLYYDSNYNLVVKQSE